MCLGPRKILCHAEIGEIRLHRHLRSSVSVTPGNSSGPFVMQAAFLGAPAEREQDALVIERRRERLGELVMLADRQGDVERRGRLLGMCGADEDKRTAEGRLQRGDDVRRAGHLQPGERLAKAAARLLTATKHVDRAAEVSGHPCRFDDPPRPAVGDDRRLVVTDRPLVPAGVLSHVPRPLDEARLARLRRG